MSSGCEEEETSYVFLCVISVIPVIRTFRGTALAKDHQAFLYFEDSYSMVE